jgi:4'-phosphopantetheinyl transferase
MRIIPAQAVLPLVERIVSTITPYANMKPIWPVPPNHPPLAADAVHVWAVAIDAAPLDIDSRLSLLTADEQRRAKSFQVATPQRQFIITRATLRTLLSRYLELPPGEVSIEIGANNKPQLAEKHSGHDLQFNVAHSGDLALIAFALGAPIGVDVERLRTMRLAVPMAQRYFHPAETMTIESAPESQRGAAFLRCWTMKEAVLKATGTGLTDRLADFYVPSETTNVGAWISVPTFAPTQFAPCCVQQLDVGDDYLAAVAVAASPRYIHCMTFTL